MSAWRRVLLLAAVGLLAVSIVSMTATPAKSSPDVFVVHCHQSPADLEWCEFVIWIATPGAADYFAWATAPRPAARAWTVWDELRLCEAPDWAGGWAANTGNGYYGGLQFTLSSWRWVGGSGYPHQATREEQIHRGERLLKLQGWDAWPKCSRELRLR